MGEDKASLPFGKGPSGREATLLDQAIINAKSCGQLNSEGLVPIVCVAARHQVLLPLPEDIEICRDESPWEGPLEALRVGLNALQTQAEYAFAIGCDTPFADHRLADFLLQRIDETQAVVFQDGDHTKSLPGLYRCEVAPIAGQLLQSNNRSLKAFAKEIRAMCLPVAELRAIDPDLRLLHNCNTPDDYRIALAMLEES